MKYAELLSAAFLALSGLSSSFSPPFSRLRPCVFSWGVGEGEVSIGCAGRRGRSCFRPDMEAPLSGGKLFRLLEAFLVFLTNEANIWGNAHFSVVVVLVLDLVSRTLNL